jgi:hypothetical protein
VLSLDILSMRAGSGNTVMVTLPAERLHLAASAAAATAEA